MADDGRKLFVGRLPRDIREEEIKLIFKTYGEVADVRIHDKEGVSGQRSAFVLYEDKASADTAMQVLNEVYKFREDAREPIEVKPARPKGAGKGGRDGGYDSYGKGGYRGDDRRPDHGYGGGGGGYGGRGYGSDDYGRGGKGGGDYGRGPPGGYDDRGGYDRGGYDRGGYDRGGYDRDGRDRGPGGYGGDKGGGGKGKGKGEPGAKLYLANLPEDITKNDLEYVFGNYGQVQDTHIMTGRSQSGQAAAFVTFADAGQASRAFEAMQQGYEIRPGQGHIIVKYANAQGPSARDAGRSRPY